MFTKGMNEGIMSIDMLRTSYPVYLYNSLTRAKELFNPNQEGAVGMYVCGPTVYGDPHLGHARSAITFDVIYRYFSFLGYRVRYVRNITDVGHLEDEIGDTGEDKIAKKARLEALEPMEVAQYYTNRYRDSMRLLNIRPPSIEPVASGHIPEQIEIIKLILEHGFAYETNGSVYFDIHEYAQKYGYGQLSGRMLDEQLSGQRELEGKEEKRHPEDFALWKKAGPSHIMKWESPWSVGFPGWHIECTAMSLKYLGLPFDIHGGGMDLKFPHHEAEIAQSYAAFGRAPVRYWLHNNMVTLNGQKMAKSKGNFISLSDMFSGEHKLLEEAYSPLTVRMFMLQAHYGSTLDFSNDALRGAREGLKKLIGFLRLLDEMESYPFGKRQMELENILMEGCERCYTHMSDDFNTARVLAELFGLGKAISEIYHGGTFIPLNEAVWNRLKATFRGFLQDVLGLEPPKGAAEVDNRFLLDLLMEVRKIARDEKNYLLADRIRDGLREAGVKMKDSRNDTQLYI